MSKHNLLTKLEPYLKITDAEKNKISNSLANYNTVKTYFKLLKQIENLHMDLKNLDHFDNFLNSQFLWNRTVNNIILEIEETVNKMEGEIVLVKRNHEYALDGYQNFTSIFECYC